MFELLLTIVAGSGAGALCGGLLAAWLLRRHHRTEDGQPDALDPWVSAEIDRAAVEFANRNGRPETAPLIADKLHLLHHLGQRQGGSE
ncbi:MAG TPA: hypothetical protein VLL27_13530 [Solirubrobacterales bacterium]|nr:hypothetical protein [Solirubrobacterales bacterium]